MKIPATSNMVENNFTTQVNHAVTSADSIVRATVCGAALVWTTIVSAAGEPFNPPEYYQKIRQTRHERVARMRENIDLNTIPRFRTVIRDENDHIVVERETWTISFNKKTASIDRVRLLDIDCTKGCSIADLHVVDADGVIYCQSLAYRASLAKRDEKFHLYLTGTFAPVSVDGRELPCRFQVDYDFYKMSGLLTVRYRVIESASDVKSLYVINTVGKTHQPLRFYSTCYGKDNKGTFLQEVHSDVESLADAQHVQGRLPYAFWTDGRIGFQVLPLRHTWEQIDVDKDAFGGKRLIVATSGRSRHLDMYFIQKKAPRQLKEGESFELALSFLPFRKYQPSYGVFHAGLAHNLVFDEFSIDTELHLRELAASGVTDIIGAIISLEPSGQQFAQSQGWIKDRYRRIIETAHKFGMSIQGGGVVNVPIVEEAFRKEKMIPEDEIAKIQSEPWSKVAVSFETQEVIDYHLDWYTSFFEEYGVDGMYLDLNCVFIPDEEWTSQIEGNVKYIEEAWLLANSYNPPKKIISHAGNQFTLLEAMSDAAFPGEGLWALHVPRIMDGLLETVYNPFLLGSEVIPLTYRSYDFRRVEIYNQFLRNALTVILPWEGKLNQFNGHTLLPEEKRLYDRYFYPLMSFDTRTAKLYHWRDSESKKVVQLSERNVVVNIFSRPGDALLVATAMGKPRRYCRATIDLASLGFQSSEAFAFNVMANSLSIVPVVSGKANLTIQGVDKEPIIIRLKEKRGDGPQVVWHDYNLEIVKFEDNTANAKPGQRKMLDIDWKFRTDPAEGQDQMFRLYVGDLGAPCVSFGVGPWHMPVENYHLEEKSIDFLVRISPLLKEPRMYFGRLLNGPRSTTLDGFIGWEKAFQLSFPQIDTND